MLAERRKRGDMKKYLLLVEDEKGLLSLEKRVSLEIRETTIVEEISV